MRWTYNMYTFWVYVWWCWGLPWWLSGKKNLPPMQELREMCVQSLGWEDPLEEGIATHSSILAWRIPWTEEPGGLQSMGLQRGRRTWSDLARTYVYTRHTGRRYMKWLDGYSWKSSRVQVLAPPETSCKPGEWRVLAVSQVPCLESGDNNSVHFTGLSWELINRVIVIR